MKNDGHIKLTVEAIKQMQRNCNVEKKLCTLPIFNADNTQWHDSSKSNQMDFISAYIGYLLNLKAYNFNALDPRRDLARRVAAVDFDESWTHNAPLGQRYHFMKASSESEFSAHLNGCRFIKQEMDKWVIQCKQKISLLDRLKNDSNPKNDNGAFMDRRYGVRHLAMSLHCLQDSFSPAHTIRSNKNIALIECRKEAKVHGAPEASYPQPIIKIFDYADQKHGSPIDISTPHSQGDIHGGSLHTGSAKLAITATSELIILGLQSVAGNEKGLSGVGWETYKAKWLLQKNLPKTINKKCA